MASLMRQLQSKAAVATELAAKHGSTFYKRLLEENKQYIQQEPTVQKCQELSKQLFYTRLARFLFLLLHVCAFVCDVCVCQLRSNQAISSINPSLVIERFLTSLLRGS